ncbi:pseudaminic acid synthase [Flavobacteriaceae bacterium]|nr:pseudaminic acid synthase [Flavobacteriaceae bacterium]MDC6479062.1 pseudaminic acid synthase [Flavobacteriaceae bacterium]
MKRLQIADFIIDESSPCFIIAELSANHGGKLETAIKTIKSAKKCGADAIKLQTFTQDTITLNSKKDDFKITQGTLWDNQYLYDLYKGSSLPWEWHEELFKVAREEGLICFSSPFDRTAVDFLEGLDTPAYKIASFEITDIPLIEYIASKGKPMIISTGISTIEDIELALETCRKEGNNQVALLKCTSSYPAPIDEANLLMIKDLSDKFDVISGLSDHTIGNTVPIVATTLGAKIIEKHFILDRSIGGTDSSFSLDESEFKLMVKSIREAEKSIGNIDYNLTEKQKKGREFSRSLYVVEKIKKGDVFSDKNIRSIRPGFGLHPKYLKQIIDEKSNQNIEKGTRFSLDYIEKLT